MKIGYYSESRADQAALAVFTEGILGESPEPINMDVEGHGVTAVLNALDRVILGLHYHSDAEGLVVVVDCDDSELHTVEHEKPSGAADDCRFCQIRKKVARAMNRLNPIQPKPLLKVAVGLAVPAIEAWFLVGKNHKVGEAAWIAGCVANKRPFTRDQLKQEVYGTEHSDLNLKTECAMKEARRIIANMAAIETAFPIGFGLMSREIKSWRQVSANA
jgi:hypothetical protein